MPLLTRLAVLAALLSLLVLFASCGGDDDDDGGGSNGGGSTAAFCDEVESIFASDNEGGGSREEQGQQLREALRDLQELDPPEEIADDWNAVMDAYAADDPADVDLAAVQKSGRRVTTYLTEECGISEE